MQSKKKVVVLHSGGLDSTLCLLLAREAGHHVVSLGIDYGQSHRLELDYAIDQCRRFDVDRHVLRVQWDKPNREIPTLRSLAEIRSKVSPAFLPARNVVFLTLACAEATGIGAEEVWIGINAIDFSGYPDCRPEFFEAFKAMMKLAVPDGPQIKAPLLFMSKPEIAAEAKRLGIGPGETWSCYQPQFTVQGIVPCKKCDACVLHDYAWDQALNDKNSDL